MLKFPKRNHFGKKSLERIRRNNFGKFLPKKNGKILQKNSFFNSQKKIRSNKIGSIESWESLAQNY